MTKGRKGKQNQSNNASFAHDDSECAICANLVTGNNNGIQCNGCTNWFHGPGDSTNCSGLPSKVVEALKTSHDCVKWFCSKCEKRENDLEKCMRELTEMKSVIKGLQRQNDVILELFKKTVEAKGNDNIMQNQTGLMPQIDLLKKKNDYKSDLDDEDRQKNVIIYNIDENFDSENSDNGKEKDLEIVAEVVKVVKPNFDVSLINKENLERLGKERKPGEKPRPIKISFTTQFPRHQILKNAYKLKNSKYQKVGLSADKSKNEREEEANLVKNLKERKSKGEDVVIFDNKIMLREERNQIVKTSSLKKDVNKD